MSEFTRDQFCFSFGELDPKVQFRTDWAGYYKGAAKLRDALVIPQGGITDRWGTIYVDTATIVQNNFLYCEISTLVFDGTATYLLVWEAQSLKIYLENIQVAVIATQYFQEDIPNLRFCQVQNRLIITSGLFPQQQLQRSANANNVITGFDGANNGLTITNNLVIGTVYPATFTTNNALPTTNPQIYQNRTYYVKPYLVNAVQIFSTSEDAINGVNMYTVTNAGAGVNNLVVQNTWAITNIAFTNVPSYDFNGGYSNITFTPSATSGNITLTASANIFTAAMVGGIYQGNGGSVRLTGFTDATHMTGFTVISFPNTNAIQGSLSFLGEPVWSATRGYPRACGFFQQRLYFGGTPVISNGVWGSVVNSVFNFDDSESLADNAISWYPADGLDVNILSMTSGQTLIVHTNNGSYSTPYGGIEVPLTPTNFVLTQKSPFGVSTIQPVFIDNQIIFVDNSGNNVINLVWQIDQGSFVTNNISVWSDNLIVNPQDMASLPQPNATNGFYVIFVNSDGTLAVYQTLFEEGVNAWSLMKTQTVIPNQFTAPYAAVTPIYLNNRFIRVTSAQNRAWFTVARQVPFATNPPVNITGFSSVTNTLTANNHGLDLVNPTMIVLTGAPLPTTNPQVTGTQYFWARGITINTFAIYISNFAAANDLNRFQIINAGVNATVTAWPIVEKLYIEELSFNVNSDSTKVYKNANTNTFTGLDYLNGTLLNGLKDNTLISLGFDPSGIVTPFNGTIVLNNVFQNVTFGSQFIATFVPLPVTVPQMEGLLFKNKNIRSLYISYFQSEGIQVNGVSLPETSIPANFSVTLSDGVSLYSPMVEWSSTTQNISITQPYPLPMTILGLSYILEV